MEVESTLIERIEKIIEMILKNQSTKRKVKALNALTFRMR
jgi:hypothetical protein